LLLALLLTLGCSLSAAVGMWRLSLRLKDAGIVDVMWGYGFGVLACVSLLVSQTDSVRAQLLVAALMLASLRLGTHLWLRCLGRDEDFRYREMREHYGVGFGRRSLVSVFLFQALVQWILSLPYQLAPHAPGAAALGWLDGLGFTLFGLGWAVEALADFQLERFRRRPHREGAVLDAGLWRYSRHPNYFGEAVMAWGLFVVVSQTQYGLWFVWSPVLLTYLLTRISGVPYLERGLLRRLPGYAEYTKRTPAFVPRMPRY